MAYRLEFFTMQVLPWISINTEKKKQIVLIVFIHQKYNPRIEKTECPLFHVKKNIESRARYIIGLDICINTYLYWVTGLVIIHYR